MRALVPSFLFATLLAAPAFADNSAADVAAARQLGTEGIKLANKGKCAEAIEKLDRAEKLFHAPTTLAKLGECHVELGKIVQGTEELRRVVREQLAADAPKPFVAAKARAEKLLAQAQPRIAMLHLVLAPSAAKADATLDGDPLSAAAIGTDWPVDPGEHTIKATASGYLEASSTIKLKDGEKKDLTLTLQVDPNPKPPPVAQTPPSPPPDQPQKPPPPAPETDARPSRLPAYIAFGVGAAGVAVGAVSGVIFLGKKSDLEKTCPNKVCTSGHSGDLDSTKTWGNISTIGFAIGAVGVATGFVLFLASGGAASDRASVTPVIGLGSAGVAGRF